MNLTTYHVSSLKEVEDLYSQWVITDEPARHLEWKVNEAAIPIFFDRGQRVYPFQHLPYSIVIEHSIKVATHNIAIQEQLKHYFPVCSDEDYQTYQLNHDSKQTFSLRFFSTIKEIEDNRTLEKRSAAPYGCRTWGKKKHCVLF